MSAKALMFQGTGSNVGKSILVAGLCRAAHNRNISVAPFKPQNMSNNAAVCRDGGEIGRAQALQARACGLAPDKHHNPVLIKPQTDQTAQLIVQGTVYAESDARRYMSDTRETLMPYVMQSFEQLKSEFDLILVEGAGSPAETNLRQGDIANMGFATMANVPVCMIADIDRCGVIASLVGTHAVLDDLDRSMIQSFIINKFRGDLSLFDDGVLDIVEHTSWWSAGVVPWLPEVALLPPEDAVPLEEIQHATIAGSKVKICVPILSRIANFDDVDPLRQEPGVHLEFVKPGQHIPLDADVVILPGTKSAIADMAFVRAQGWDIDLAALARAGRYIIGLCGGYQLLGKHITDDYGSDGAIGQCPGLGLLDVATHMGKDKTLTESQGTHVATGANVVGYEIHMGRTTGPDSEVPFLRLGSGPDGACSSDGQVCGTYLHGLFNADQFRRAWLNNIRQGSASERQFDLEVDNALNQLASSLEDALDVDRLFKEAR